MTALSPNYLLVKSKKGRGGRDQVSRVARRERNEMDHIMSRICKSRGKIRRILSARVFLGARRTVVKTSWRRTSIRSSLPAADFVPGACIEIAPAR